MEAWRLSPPPPNILLLGQRYCNYRISMYACTVGKYLFSARYGIKDSKEDNSDKCVLWLQYCCNLRRLFYTTTLSGAGDIILHSFRLQRFPSESQLEFAILKAPSPK